MKSIFKILSLVSMMVLAMACTEEPAIFLEENPQMATLSVPFNNAVLNQENADENITFTWERTNYGYNAAVTYTVQIAMAGTDFAEPVNLVSSTTTQASVTTAEFNQRLIALGIQADSEGEIEVRLRSRLDGTDIDDMFSNPSSMVVTPYFVELTFPRLYIPGDYQGWDPTRENTIIYSERSNNIYSGYIHVYGGSGFFKINEGPSWDVNYGDNGADGTLDQNGDNINVGADFGTFKLDVDMNELTYTLGAPIKWRIIGSATPGGWDADTDMTFNPDENVMEITTDLVVGELKFRGNADWGSNFGDDNGDGVLEANGGNIQVPEAGNYTIRMDWKTPGQVSYTLVKN